MISLAKVNVYIQVFFKLDFERDLSYIWLNPPLHYISLHNMLFPAYLVVNWHFFMVSSGVLLNYYLWLQLATN